MEQLHKQEFQQRYELLLPAIQTLGKEAVRLFDGREIEKWDKPDGTKVTTADINLNQQWIDIIAMNFPDDLVWGEEGCNIPEGQFGTKGDLEAAGKRWMWLIDPIDGTSGFWRAYQSNERQLEIINQILHVTRADSGRLVLHKEKLDLNEIIKTVISEHSQPVKARDQKVMFKKGSPKMIISADRQYLTMAMDNLLSNASKYSHTKTTIRITTEQVGREVVIKVTDKGVGIHADDMHRLFQKFSRIDNELSVEAGGNGIGLYLCREVIALHGGDIAVESEPGKGSVFVVTLPKR